MQPSSSKYEKPLHAFELVFDKKSVLVEVEENDVDALPLPTKLTLTSFTDIKQQVLQATTDLNKKEFDILAIVVNCFPPRYLMSMNKWLQELIVMDILKYKVCSLLDISSNQSVAPPLCTVSTLPQRPVNSFCQNSIQNPTSTALPATAPLTPIFPFH
uniref:Uncharacterized protein n=1 Tax=Solanum tuberosum TaxID=4113 RepID=M1B0D3_SOLTU